MRTNPDHRITRVLLGVAIFLLLPLSACSLSLLKIPPVNIPTINIPTAASPTLATPAGPTPTPQPSAGTTFKVTIPTPLLPGEVLDLSVLDEVTGIGLNPTNYTMQGMDPLHYSVNIPFPMDSVIKYRYMRQSTLPTLEDDAADKAVRYRILQVTGPGEVNDVVSAWADGHFNSPSGRITGTVLDAANQTPLVNILIAAGGQQTLTDSNGNFNVAALPEGTHNLVAYAIDGSYQTFQQGATVAAGKTTNVILTLTKASLINVTFTVSVPKNGFQNLPIRLAGNLYQLGDVFADLQGGVNTVASRMPLMTPMADGRYSVTLALPVGADLHYKYTLGDGFWNAEHNADGTFAVRQLVVPDSPNPFMVDDTVQTWQAGPSSPILFEVGVPAITPVSDTISIQFNPYGWTEPLPMWPRGNNQWVYVLYSPLNMLGSFQYRYCRNDQCGVADDTMTAGNKPGRPISTSLAPQDLQDTVSSWNWLPGSGPASLVGMPVTARAQGFWAGIEFLQDYDPTWQAWMPTALQNVKGIFANWVVLTPSWTVSRTSPFTFSPMPGSDPLWADNLDTISHARASNINVALFPGANLPAESGAWWQSAPKDPAWWSAWFDQYAAFAAYHADLATKSGAQALILGGDWVGPALPGGQVNGSDSGVPQDAATRWQAILADVRKRFSGQVLWAVTYHGPLGSLPDFVKSLDGIYLLWNAPLSGSSVDDLKASAEKLLDTDIQPIQATLGKPFILAAAYASADGSSTGTITENALFLPGLTQYPVNLSSQADVYQALLEAVNERAWLGGFVSRGYYPPAVLLDASASVHGKPAADQLWYWYARLTGASQ